MTNKANPAGLHMGFSLPRVSGSLNPIVFRQNYWVFISDDQGVLMLCDIAAVFGHQIPAFPGIVHIPRFGRNEGFQGNDGIFPEAAFVGSVMEVGYFARCVVKPQPDAMSHQVF